MSDQPINPPSEQDLYRDALLKAWAELEGLKQEERRIILRKAQLTKTCSALFPLVFSDPPDVNALSLPNAIRLVISSADRPLSANDMLTKLEDVGFDMKKFDNPLANILTAMKRMADSEELVLVDGDKKRVVAGPQLKAAPDVSANRWEAVIAGVMLEDGIYTPPAPVLEQKSDTEK
jgi:hypothetical protein